MGWDTFFSIFPEELREHIWQKCRFEKDHWRRYSELALCLSPGDPHTERDDFWSSFLAWMSDQGIELFDALDGPAGEESPGEQSSPSIRSLSDAALKMTVLIRLVWRYGKWCQEKCDRLQNSGIELNEELFEAGPSRAFEEGWFARLPARDRFLLAVAYEPDFLDPAAVPEGFAENTGYPSNQDLVDDLRERKTRRRLRRSSRSSPPANLQLLCAGLRRSKEVVTRELAGIRACLPIA